MGLPVSIKLSSIYCWDEADSIGNAEPYLWTIFFKIDGETIKQFGVALQGEAVFHFGAGSHENLRTHAVDRGESVKIPPAVGEWSTVLQPIVLTNPATNKQYFIPGTVGVAAVLMEQDNVSDSGAEAGHKALNQFVQNSINSFIQSIRLTDFASAGNSQEVLNQKVRELVASIKAGAGSQVESAIRSKQPWYSDLWSGVDPDDNVGSEIFMFNQDDIVQNRYGVGINKRWKNEGDWELFGSISAPNPCMSFLIPVNKQKIAIEGVEDQIKGIRKEMRRANASQRAELQKEIDELEEVLKPMEKELQRLRGLLNRCYAEHAP